MLNVMPEGMVATIDEIVRATAPTAATTTAMAAEMADVMMTRFEVYMAHIESKEHFEGN